MAKASLTLSAERVRFAWLPVQLWRLAPSGFVVPTRKVWLCRVHEIETIFGEWTAYEEYQNQIVRTENNAF